MNQILSQNPFPFYPAIQGIEISQARSPLKFDSGKKAPIINDVMLLTGGPDDEGPRAKQEMVSGSRVGLEERFREIPAGLRCNYQFFHALQSTCQGSVSSSFALLHSVNRTRVQTLDGFWRRQSFLLDRLPQLGRIDVLKEIGLLYSVAIMVGSGVMANILIDAYQHGLESDVFNIPLMGVLFFIANKTAQYFIGANPKLLHPKVASLKAHSDSNFRFIFVGMFFSSLLFGKWQAELSSLFPSLSACALVIARSEILYRMNKKNVTETLQNAEVALSQAVDQFDYEAFFTANPSLISEASKNVLYVLEKHQEILLGRKTKAKMKKLVLPDNDALLELVTSDIQTWKTIQASAENGDEQTTIPNNALLERYKKVVLELSPPKAC